ncbi:hypothetical protein [uncultured Massilia sp.]|uniref:hypothetical protein n=1 Tax=uncultured Massilia sp. TaxID=169973 RepID=UPI0025CF4742|nr:hypothetical protein [uncultured Massilia sp.]
MAVPSIRPDARVRHRHRPAAAAPLAPVAGALRTPRGDALDAAGARLPARDPATHLLRTGQARGACGTCAWLAGLPLAADAVRERGAALFLANPDPVRRDALVVAPAPSLSRLPS